MSPAVLTCAGLLALALLATSAGWWLPRSRWIAGLAVVGLAGAALTAGVWVDEPASGAAAGAGLVVLTGALAVLGGGPVTTAVFGLVDGGGDQAAGSVRRAAEVLRGGAWIGALERAAVYTSLATGWPEGLAIALALKGLGRYPELRHEDRPGIAERFLIGTFVSVLWACGCAGVALLLLA